MGEMEKKRGGKASRRRKSKAERVLGRSRLGKTVHYFRKIPFRVGDTSGSRETSEILKPEKGRNRQDKGG